MCGRASRGFFRLLSIFSFMFSCVNLFLLLRASYTHAVRIGRPRNPRVRVESTSVTFLSPSLDLTLHTSSNWCLVSSPQIELGEGRFALRAFSNRRFLRVTPPLEGDWTVWVLEVGHAVRTRSTPDKVLLTMSGRACKFGFMCDIPPRGSSLDYQWRLFSCVRRYYCSVDERDAFLSR